MIDVHTIMPSLVYVFLFLSLPAYILAKSIFSPILNPGSDAAETRDPLTRSDLYQGDILLLGDERERNALNGGNFRWENGRVPYIIDSALSGKAKSAIEAAISDYNLFTCVRFVPRTDEYNYVRFFSGDGCYSYVGRTYGAQPVSLGVGCEIKGIAIHEMAHALGFYHEQSRSDRDDWVTINWSNIPVGSRSQFEKAETNNLQTQYDYNSLMHYGPKSFSLNGSPTITPKTAGVSIGQRKGFSTIDVTKINRLYGCPEKLETTVTTTVTVADENLTTLKSTATSTSATTTIKTSTLSVPRDVTCVDQWSQCPVFYRSPVYTEIVCLYYKGICKKTCNSC